MMILLALLCLVGTPLFAIIAASAMIGYQSEGIDLMALVVFNQVYNITK